MGKHNEFGKEGEKIAAAYLIEKGYTIQQKNYRYQKSEIDIIAQKGGILAIVEVRARSTDHIIPIAATITHKKIQLLVRGANHYVTSRKLDNVEVRFDVITILKNSAVFRIEHLESAFYHF
ncbi:YraN family protein [Pricia sp.]|uniref:YraN family protein n=1 Tax=Pricia sp. TaxID=2268138 RepID=UPI0035947B29